MGKNNKKFVIGIDGGGTKTVAALADSTGRILKIFEDGPSNPRNLGIKTAVDNISRTLSVVLRKNIIISSVFLGLPAVEEEFKNKKERLKKELLGHKEISGIFKTKIIIGSDQLVAFRSGTDKTDGIVIIDGTGAVVHGWKNKKDYKASGWGWLADEGCASWVGEKVFQAVLKDLDGRGPATLLTKHIFKNFGITNARDLANLVYSKNPTVVIPKFSIICDETSRSGDKVAKEIMVEAGKEIALAALAVIKKLSFQKEEFPLVMVGSMFKSPILLETTKKEIRKTAPKANFIRPKNKPVFGAVKLAIESLGR